MPSNSPAVTAIVVTMAVAIAACPELHYLRELHAFFISLDLPAAYVLCNAKLAREMLIAVGRKKTQNFGGMFRN